MTEGGASSPIVRSAGVMFIIAMICFSLVLLLFEHYDEEIALGNERLLAQKIQRVLGQASPTMPADGEVLAVDDIDWRSDIARIDRAFVYRDAEAVRAVVLLVTGRGGYGGDFQLIAGYDHRGTLLGIEVIRHAETPGLGDVIDSPHALRHVTDGVTGASITINAVRAVLSEVQYVVHRLLDDR